MFLYGARVRILKRNLYTIYRIRDGRRGNSVPSSFKANKGYFLVPTPCYHVRRLPTLRTIAIHCRSLLFDTCARATRCTDHRSRVIHYVYHHWFFFFLTILNDRDELVGYTGRSTTVAASGASGFPERFLHNNNNNNITNAADENAKNSFIIKYPHTK